jgi:hypothetical protein
LSPLPLLLLIVLALLLPMKSDDLFNGLPLDSGAEAVGLLLIVPLLLSSALRRHWSVLRGGWRLWVAYAVVVGVIVLKGVALVGGDDGVYVACYRSLATAPAVSSNCERSFADPLQISGSTRFEPLIDVPPAQSLADSKWNLDWVNRLGLNERHFTLPGTRPPRVGPPRERLPFSVEWRGTLPESAPRLLLVRYVGEGEISVGGRPRRLPPAYEGPREFEVPRAVDQQELRAALAFAPSAERAEPYAAFELLDAETRQPVAAADRHRLISLVILVGTLGVLATILLAYVRAVGWSVGTRVGLAILIGTAVTILGAAGGRVPEARAAGIAACVFVVLAAQAWSPRRHLMLTAFLALLALVPTTALLADSETSAVIYRPYGEDWLAYQGHAHEILRTGSLEGGESVFYYQPAMRYVLFAGHALFGAGDVLPVAVAMGLFALAVTLCLVRLVPGFAASSAAGVRVRERLRRSRGLLAALAVVALLFALVHVGVERFVGYGASEAPTWFLMPAAVALLLGASSRAAWATGSALVGVLVALRLESLPAALFLLVLFSSLAGRRRERVAWAVGGLFLALAAIALHNVVYGSELALVRAEVTDADGGTVVGQDSSVSALGNLSAALSDATARAELVARVEAILYLPFDASLTRVNLAQRLPFHGLLLAWLAAVAFVMLRWRQTTWMAKGVAALPLVVLGPFLAFDVATYYPRQIVLGYVTMGIAVIYVLGHGRRSSPANPLKSQEEGLPRHLHRSPRLRLRRRAVAK